MSISREVGLLQADEVLEILRASRTMKALRMTAAWAAIGP
jgi:hypothetical protein